MKHFLIPILIYAALFLASPATLCTAGDGIVITEDIQLKLGDAFLSEGEYYRAVTEYMKFLILFPGSRKGDYALFNIGMAYSRGDEHKKAADAFVSVREKYSESALAPAAGFHEGLSYVRLEMPDMAGKAFDRVVKLYPSSWYAPTALLGKSLLLLGGRDISGCRKELERFLAEYPDDARGANVREAITLLNQKGELPQKSPLLAGFMSALIPGSGHIYAGHYGDGITSLFLNGLFIAGTVVAIRQENYAVSGIVGVIGLPFYFGNIYGAANAATKWNLAVRMDLQGKMAVTLDYRF
jgi:tetratricopeptide (TPR) repeat protein